MRLGTGALYTTRSVLSGVEIMSSLFGLSLRAYLAGTWRIERNIDDRRTALPQSFTGEAVFEGDADCRYREEGTLRIGDRIIRASQSHRWAFADNHADVSFADGRPFHRVTLDDHGADAIHDCPPDLYRVSYHFETPDRWRQRWHVTGPRKDYTLESVFTRLHHVIDPVQSPPDQSETR